MSAYAYMYMFLFSLPSQQLQKWQPHSSISLVIPLSAGSLYSYSLHFSIQLLRKEYYWGGFPSSYLHSSFFNLQQYTCQKCTICKCYSIYTCVCKDYNLQITTHCQDLEFNLVCSSRKLLHCWTCMYYDHNYSKKSRLMFFNLLFNCILFFFEG